MKKYISSLSMAILVLSTIFAGISFAGGAEDSQSSSFDYIEGQLVVSVEESPSHSIKKTNHLIRQTETLAKKGFKVVNALFDQEDKNSIKMTNTNDIKKAVEKMGLVYLVEYSIKDYKSIQSAKKELEKILTDLGLNVRYITGNYKMYALETASTENVTLDMHPNQRWHYEMIKAPQAWEITTGSSSIRMAVLDTGIDSNHPSLRNLVDTSLGRSFVGGSTQDGNGHGTHVAGTIASYGAVSGVMQNATLIPVKVLSDSGSGSMYGIQQGILYAAGTVNADVINMSLGGGGYDRGMDEAVQTAVSMGTIVVAAAGNDGRPSISYPAAYSDAIAVGSVTSNRTRSSFSNYGDGLEVMAPGSNIYSTYPNGQYSTLSGTSMASPHAAGVLGLMRSVNPNLSVTQARSILRDTAQPAGDRFQYGYGIVDAHAAVQAVGGGTPPPDQPGDEELVVALQTDKTVYQRGDNIHMTATVKDENNAALQGATVHFTVQRPNGTTVSESVTTNSSGVATWTLGSNDQTALGTYTITAEASLSGYQPGSASTTIQFSDGDQDPTPPEDPPTTTWAPGVAYKIGDEVTYDNDAYVCLQAHTSFVGWEPPNAPALWQRK